VDAPAGLEKEVIGLRASARPGLELFKRLAEVIAIRRRCDKGRALAEEGWLARLGEEILPGPVAQLLHIHEFGRSNCRDGRQNGQEVFLAAGILAKQRHRDLTPPAAKLRRDTTKGNACAQLHWSGI